MEFDPGRRSELRGRGRGRRTDHRWDAGLPCQRLLQRCRRVHRPAAVHGLGRHRKGTELQPHNSAARGPQVGRDGYAHHYAGGQLPGCAPQRQLLLGVPVEPGLLGLQDRLHAAAARARQVHPAIAQGRLAARPGRAHFQHLVPVPRTDPDVRLLELSVVRAGRRPDAAGAGRGLPVDLQRGGAPELVHAGVPPAVDRGEQSAEVGGRRSVPVLAPLYQPVRGRSAAAEAVGGSVRRADRGYLRRRTRRRALQRHHRPVGDGQAACTLRPARFRADAGTEGHARRPGRPHVA